MPVLDRSNWKEHDGDRLEKNWYWMIWGYWVGFEKFVVGGVFGDAERDAEVERMMLIEV